MAYLGKTREPEFFFHASPETIELAKRLREKMTLCEKLLWERLRRKNIRGVKFRRQHPVEYYIADFYCHELRLVIEVDGPVHERVRQRSHDEKPHSGTGKTDTNKKEPDPFSLPSKGRAGEGSYVRTRAGEGS